MLVQGRFLRIGEAIVAEVVVAEITLKTDVEDDLIANITFSGDGLASLEDVLGSEQLVPAPLFSIELLRSPLLLGRKSLIVAVGTGEVPVLAVEECVFLHSVVAAVVQVESGILEAFADAGRVVALGAADALDLGVFGDCPAHTFVVGRHVLVVGVHRRLLVVVRCTSIVRAHWDLLVVLVGDEDAFVIVLEGMCVVGDRDLCLFDLLLAPLRLTDGRVLSNLRKTIQVLRDGHLCSLLLESVDELLLSSSHEAGHSKDWLGARLGLANGLGDTTRLAGDEATDRILSPAHGTISQLKVVEHRIHVCGFRDAGAGRSLAVVNRLLIAGIVEASPLSSVGVLV